MKKTSSKALGPYNRYILWTQGCLRRCKGCITPDSRSLDGGYLIDNDYLVQEILSSDIEGITISGGEPFLQPEDLVYVINEVKKKKDVGVIVYTGNTLKGLIDKNDPSINLFLSLIDLLIDGEYVEELDDGKSLRGSSNQNVIPLTDRYKNVIKEYYGVDGRNVEFILYNDSYQMIGIPSEEVKRILKTLKK